MFWNRFVELCAKEGTTPTAVVSKLKISGGSVTKWKNGSIPNPTTIVKIAEYFNVSTEYLSGNTEQKEKPSEEGEDMVIVSRNGERLVHHLNQEQIKLLEDMIRQFGNDKK